MIKDVLPKECKDITISPGCWTTLQHRVVGSDVYVVYLNSRTNANKLWIVPCKEYWRLEPKHGTRDRYVRENYPPDMEDVPPLQLTLNL